MAKIKSAEQELREAQEELEMLLSDPEKREIYEQRIVDLRDKISYGRTERNERQRRKTKASCTKYV